ncbi:MAG: SAM-dependent methyltransferase, partial [Nitrosopumilaceae archaeon]
MHKVYFVGCGPGDPELLTVKAKKLIEKADIIVYSGSLIPDDIIKLCKKAQLYDAAKLVREEIFKILHDNALKGKLVVRLHDGDPTIYGAIKEQTDNLKEEKIDYEIVPGITSFLASAAALG